MRLWMGPFLSAQLSTGALLITDTRRVFHVERTAEGRTESAVRADPILPCVRPGPSISPTEPSRNSIFPAKRPRRWAP